MFNNLTSSGYTALRKLSTTLLDRPELVANVKVLRFSDFDPKSVEQIANVKVLRSSCFKHDSMEQGLSRDTRVVFARRFEERLEAIAMPASAREELRTRLYRAQHGALMVAVICLCSKLKGLHHERTATIYNNEEGEGELLASIVRTGPSLSQPPILQHLENLKLGCTIFATKDGGSYLSPLLALPKLQRVVTSFYGVDPEPVGLPNPFIKLEELTLAVRGIEDDGLKIVLTGCPNLKALTIGWQDRESMEYAVYERFGGFGDVLRQFGRSLEKLKLWYEGSPDDVAWEYRMPLLGSLGSLQNLRELALPLQLNPDWKDFDPDKPLHKPLPSSIEVLEIYDVAYSTMVLHCWLVELLMSVKYPALRKLRIEGRGAALKVNVGELGWGRRGTEGWVEFVRKGAFVRQADERREVEDGQVSE